VDEQEGKLIPFPPLQEVTVRFGKPMTFDEFEERLRAKRQAAADVAAPADDDTE
jgi:hypothetical protein